VLVLVLTKTSFRLFSRFQLGRISVHDMLRIRHRSLRRSACVRLTLLKHCVGVLIRHILLTRCFSNHSNFLACDWVNHPGLPRYLRASIALDYFGGAIRVDDMRVAFGVNEKIGDFPGADESIVYGQCGAKFLDLRDTNGFEETENVCLAVVGDEVVSRARATNVLYDSFACAMTE
jgi:hypothetical protein